jgi:hypothetical protein
LKISGSVPWPLVYFIPLSSTIKQSHSGHWWRWCAGMSTFASSSFVGRKLLNAYLNPISMPGWQICV